MGEMRGSSEWLSRGSETMSTCKGKRDRERGNKHTQKTGETSDGAVVRLVVCPSGNGRGEPKEERKRRY